MAAFSPDIRRRCIDLTGIDPDDSLNHLLLEIKAGGPVSDRLCRALAGHTRSDPFGKLGKPLTRREREVMTLVAAGFERPEIATILVITVETVKSTIKSALDRIGARNRTQAVALLVARQEFDLDAIDSAAGY